MRELPGRCGNCGNRLDPRQVEVREDEDDNNSKIICWLVYGYCDKCKIVYMLDFLEQEKEPQLGEDITINWDKNAIGTKDSPNLNKEKQNG